MPSTPRPSAVTEGRAATAESRESLRGRGTAAAVISSFVFPLVLTQFIASYAGSNMNVAITSIAADLGTTTHGVQTAITLFTLTMAALMGTFPIALGLGAGGCSYGFQRRTRHHRRHGHWQRIVHDGLNWRFWL